MCQGMYCQQSITLRSRVSMALPVIPYCNEKLALIVRVSNDLKGHNKNIEFHKILRVLKKCHEN